MLEELKEEAIVNKVGGRFKLSTLIQKRLVALNTGAKPLVELRTNDKLAIVVQEILQDKIFLDVLGNVQARNATMSASVDSLMHTISGTRPPALQTQPKAPPAPGAMDDDDD